MSRPPCATTSSFSLRWRVAYRLCRRTSIAETATSPDRGQPSALISTDDSSVDDNLLGPRDLDVDDDVDLNFSLLESWNITDNQELQCLIKFVGEPYPPLDYSSDLYSTSGEEVSDSGLLFCNRTWDSVLCWPTTFAGSTATLPCNFELNGVKYDSSQNATRVCLSNGTWANYTNYSSCTPLSLEPTDTDDLSMSEDTTTIYFTGYTVSIIALTVALWIFTHFKDLRCLRNTIHTHLLITYIMADLTWIVTAILQIYIGETNKGSCIIVIFLHYFHLTNFFWMFVEGFYLYMLVVETFSADKIKLRIYAFIGWGLPLPIVVVWAVVKAKWHFLPSTSDGHRLDLETFLLSDCPWMSADSYDWIYMTPAIIVLFVNILFLVKIMWVLITKLRSANSVETQQYRKGSKALLVLIPLLGLTYVLVIAGPSKGISKVIFSHIRAVLLSTQGFSVTLFYCFLNTEVRNAVRHHWERWRTRRGLHHSRRRGGGGGVAGSGPVGSVGGAGGPGCGGIGALGNRSPKEGSRTFSESTRLYNSFQDRCGSHRHHKRDASICDSEVTTVTNFPMAYSTSIHLNNMSAGTNGNGYSGLMTSSRLSNGSSIVTTGGRFSGDSANLLIRENQV